ncbi:MAG: rRNA pseudouridine synthase, partial [Bacteroidetes bacterium]|nr:rRNA pseudouridine synthase [Bacteroidota bacterium]
HLDRVTFGGLTKKDLPRGIWRKLSSKEVGFLKMLP